MALAEAGVAQHMDYGKDLLQEGGEGGVEWGREGVRECEGVYIRTYIHTV